MLSEPHGIGYNTGFNFYSLSPPAGKSEKCPRSRPALTQTAWVSQSPKTSVPLCLREILCVLGNFYTYIGIH